MKVHLFRININRILVLFNLLIFSLSLKSNILPLFKFCISKDLNLLIKKNNSLFLNDIKGVGVIFDSDSKINLIPNYLLKYIEKFLDPYYSDYSPSQSEYKELILYGYYDSIESIHFIFENFGISIPIKELLIEKDILIEPGIQGFKFYSKDEQEYIVFGKDLIELMNIDILNGKNIIINNENYISKLES